MPGETSSKCGNSLSSSALRMALVGLVEDLVQADDINLYRTLDDCPRDQLGSLWRCVDRRDRRWEPHLHQRRPHLCVVRKNAQRVAHDPTPPSELKIGWTRSADCRGASRGLGSRPLRRAPGDAARWLRHRRPPACRRYRRRTPVRPRSSARSISALPPAASRMSTRRLPPRLRRPFRHRSRAST